VVSLQTTDFTKTAIQIVPAEGVLKAITMVAEVVADVEVEAAEATATTATLVGFQSRLEFPFY